MIRSLVFLERYVEYLVKRYPINRCSIVFDGYNSGPSTKDMTQSKRSSSVFREFLCSPELK